MLLTIRKKIDNFDFTILAFLNFLLIFVLNIKINFILIVISSLFLIFLIISSKEKIFIFFSLTIFFSYQFTFYLQLIINLFDLQNITIGNFYTDLKLIDIYDIYKPIHNIVVIFIISLTSFSILVRRDNTFGNKIVISDNLKLKIMNFFLVFNVILFLIISFDIYNNNFNHVERKGIFFQLMSLNFFGQIIRKIYYLNYFVLSFFAFRNELFQKKQIICLLIAISIALLNTSRLEIIFLFIIFLIGLIKKNIPKKIIFILIPLIPILWSTLGILRIYTYTGVFKLYNVFETYTSVVWTIIGRVSYLFELSIIYYSKIFGDLSQLNYFWQALIPSKFLENKMKFYATDFQIMLDLNLINNFYPESNTAGLGLIGESYYFFGNNFWILSLFFSFIIFLYIKLIINFENNLKNSFVVYFLFIFGLKDTFIAASPDIVFIFFVLISLNLYTKVNNNN